MFNPTDERTSSSGKEQTMRKIMMAVGLAAMTLSVTACNTVRGAGQDIESVADDVDDAT
jgi:entericidin B